VTIQERIKVVDVLAITAEPPLVVDHEISVAAAIDEMRRTRSGCAMVTRDDKLIGLFTERDVLARVVGNADALVQPVSALMTPDPVCVTEDDPVHEAIVQMHRGGFRNVPVVDAGRAPVGCIRHKDVIVYLVESFADRTLNLPPDPDQSATRREGA
jgi:CBS domain-containing protein